MSSVIKHLQRYTAESGGNLALVGAYARGFISHATSSEENPSNIPSNVTKLWSAVKSESFDRRSIDAGMLLLTLSGTKAMPEDFESVHALCTHAKSFADKIVDQESLEREVADFSARFQGETAVSAARDLLSGLHDLSTISKVLANIDADADYAPDVQKALADLQAVSWIPSIEVSDALSNKLKEAFSPSNTSLALLALEVNEDCKDALKGENLALGMWSEWDRKKSLFAAAKDALQKGRFGTWTEDRPRHMTICQPTLRGDKNFLDALNKDKEELLASSDPDSAATQDKWERIRNIYLSHASEVYKVKEANPQDKDAERGKHLIGVWSKYTQASDIMQKCIKDVSLENAFSPATATTGISRAGWRRLPQELKALGIEIETEAGEATWENVRSAWASKIRAEKKEKESEADSEGPNATGRTPSVDSDAQYVLSGETFKEQQEAVRLLTDILRTRFTSKDQIQFTVPDETD